jgi:NADPH:quinone reductase-like Zn-dependent oxidoreductase
MKAIVLREAGCGPRALRLETDPVPGAGEVIVRAATLNHRDLLITRASTQASRSGEAYLLETARRPRIHDGCS